ACVATSHRWMIGLRRFGERQQHLPHPASLILSRHIAKKLASAARLLRDISRTPEMCWGVGCEINITLLSEFFGRVPASSILCWCQVLSSNRYICAPITICCVKWKEHYYSRLKRPTRFSSELCLWKGFMIEMIGSHMS
ncbi:unnamed protein product, partial [Closterium sp. NIES-64]